MSAAEHSALSPPGGPAPGPPGEPGANPGLRLAARLLDLLLLALALWGVRSLAAPGFRAPALSWRLGVAAAALAPVLLCVAWIPLETAFLASSGTTPGKWLLGMWLTTASGRRPGVGAALRRSASVAVRGLALGVAPLALFTGLAAARSLREEGVAPWDLRAGLVVRRRSVDLRRELVAALAGAVACALLLPPLGRALRTPDGDGQRGRARSYLEDWYGSVEDWVQEAGGRVVQVGDPEVGILAEGDGATVARRLAAGATVLVIATCDDTCSELGLQADAPNGESMGDAGDGTTEPSVSFTAPRAGRYAFHVAMSACSTSRCAFALQVLSVEGAAAALLATDGTCFAVSPDGALLTAAHVIEDARRITVAFPGRPEEPAEVVRSDPDVDLALLRVRSPTPDYLAVPKESSAHMGDRVFTVGYPAATLLGASPKFAEGAISSLEGGGENDSLLQMTVPVQPGNSGGPVVDEGGRLVGIVSATAEDQSFYQETGAYPQNVSFAVKAELAGELAPFAPPLPPAGSRTAVIARVRRATCRVLVR